MVIAGVGITLLPELALGDRDQIAVRPFRRPVPTRQNCGGLARQESLSAVAGIIKRVIRKKM